MRETWRQVRRCGPCHKVSSRGRVRSCPRVLPNGVEHGGQMLKPYPDKDGYLCVKLHGRTVKVHHLVLDAFHGERPAGMEGCHGPGGRQDNRSHVLRWDTHPENMKEIGERNKKRQPERLDLIETHLPRTGGTPVTVGAAGG